MSDIWTPTDALGLGGSPDEVAKQLYGYMASYLDDPEIGPILRTAAAGGWSTDMLKGALSKTQWWQTTSGTARTWDAEAAQDPASANQKISEKASQIRSELVSIGVPNIDDNTIRKIATDSLRGGWSDQQTKLALDAELRRSPDVLRSKIGTQYKMLADQYAVPMSDAAIQGWAARSIAGTASDETYREYLVVQAKDRFQVDKRKSKNFEDFLNGGGTPDQYFEPLRQIAARTLGVNPDSIRLADEKWLPALSGTDQKTGEIREMTMDEWTHFLKTDPRYGYDNTDQAKSDRTDLGHSLLQAFGRVA